MYKFQMLHSMRIRYTPNLVITAGFALQVH